MRPFLVKRQTVSGERQWQKTSLIVSENKKCIVLLKSLGKARRQEGDEAVKHEYVNMNIQGVCRSPREQVTPLRPSPRQTLVEQTYAYFDL